MSPCYNPICLGTDTAHGNKPLTVACGQCIGCRLERSRSWAVRCMHEASLYDFNCMVTLTYANLPPNGSLCLRDIQLFMKRLRKHISCYDLDFKVIPFKWRRHLMPRVRFFQCGEYGEKFQRPHHHILLFGFKPMDLCDFKGRSINEFRPNAFKVWDSPLLSSLWSHGYVAVGDLTFESAAYVARYVTKKVTGADAEAYYVGRKAEFLTMSRRPGIGAGWISKFESDVYPSDFVVVRGDKCCKPPKFYDTMYSGIKAVKKDRVAKAALRIDDNNARRLIDKGIHQHLRARDFKRGYEDDC